MKAVCVAMAAGLSLMSAMSPAAAQYYGGRDSGYGDRDGGYRGDRDRGRDRGYESRGRDDEYESRGRGRDRQDAFDEREYLRCNPDVRQALRNGQLTSALAHYQKFGRREGRRLSC